MLSFDISQRAVISYVYEFPFGRNKKLLNHLPRAFDMMVKGWQANGITPSRPDCRFTLPG